ncbi:hypothetical protein N7532_008421 [Penicillium argentinense]|uniref:Rhodopsin domain-containing protein n=1 Tax=Penicillium argentinense TaxID=1131581 RepID=A0A9W9EXF0_9EURO|nr:uncharacterized protein N7532_008421 [Penicillium argentinense]KAJ5089737.1 hypothetical protein N7532_008421 [Penicillium argentinense]
MTDMPDVTYGGKGPLLLGVTWSEMGLALILIVLRAKTASVCPPGQPSSGIFGLRWDFVWVILAFMVALAAQSTVTVSVQYGLGNHQNLLSHENLVRTNLWSWVAQVLAILDLVIARIAVIAFLLSIQGRTMYKSRYLLYAVGTIQALINIIEVGLIFRQCEPTEKLWDAEVPGTCDNVVICSQVGFAQGSIGAAADFFLAFYPIYIIGRLQLMKLSTKIGLCLLMGGGLIAGIAGINKTTAIASITHAEDLTYSIAKLDTWVLTEMWFIIIFGSIPVLRPFFVRFTQDIKVATGHSSSTKNSSGSGESRNQRESWVRLNDNPQTNFAPHGSAYTSASHDTEHSQRRLAEATGKQILVTRDTSVVSERF